ncbi:MAG: hypothetical protein DWQ47_08625 [Acidobacteria bacterium]|nr:MAG: hypothetical protein DWQ32_16725 [Acidobacteriota bacterium]REJ99027.1 MAG: hypothetical protein DWQ38_13255 [Acidobacteriota bacterium]REK16252.1 MAG: hypothetical protein DWQ43_04435 [Acidobacteriota bacterium]REK43933.1 MAG: hypothetical protein DWQ47_08625 [Acidobacteriota bacterium]
MNRENLLFGCIGLLLGLIVGFVGSNYMNRSSAPAVGSLATDQTALPENHPSIDGQTETAMIADVQATLELADQEPDNFDAQVKAGEMFFRIRRFDEAVKYYTRASELRPDDRQVMVNLGNVNFDAERLEEAEKWYAAALEKKADDVTVRTDMGLTFLLRKPKDIDRAIAEFNKSLEYDPKHALTLQNLVVAYTEARNFEKANETVQRLEEADPGNAVIPKLKESISKAAANGQGAG